MGSVIRQFCCSTIMSLLHFSLRFYFAAILKNVVLKDGECSSQSLIVLFETPPNLLPLRQLANLFNFDSVLYLRLSSTSLLTDVLTAEIAMDTRNYGNHTLGGVKIRNTDLPQLTARSSYRLEARLSIGGKERREWSPKCNKERNIIPIREGRCKWISQQLAGSNIMLGIKYS